MRAYTRTRVYVCVRVHVTRTCAYAREYVREYAHAFKLRYNATCLSSAVSSLLAINRQRNRPLRASIGRRHALLLRTIAVESSGPAILHLIGGISIGVSA